MSKISTEQWDAAAMRYEAGEKPRRICKDLGISIGLFNWNMLRLGADPPGAKVLPARAPGPAVVKRNGFTVRHFSAAEDRALEELASEGFGDTAIGRQIGRRPNSVKGRLMTLARHAARREYGAKA